MEIKNNTDIEKTNMENYKVILVDDEEEVIDAIKSRILWEQLGLQIVGSATNGVKALELVEKLQPDIVITDTVSYTHLDVYKRQQQEHYSQL